MKALLCERWAHYSELKLADVPRPALKPGQVRIAVHYATAGFGQTLVVAGKYQRRPPLPFVPGTEVSGRVLEVASDVTAFRPGDRVVAALDWGGYAEEAVATALTTWPVPDGIDLADAVNVPLSYGTSYAALHWRARMQRGENARRVRRGRRRRARCGRARQGCRRTRYRCCGKQGARRSGDQPWRCRRAGSRRRRSRPAAEGALRRSRRRYRVRSRRRSSCSIRR